MIDTFDLNTATEPLLSWFSQHARVLPWRSEPTPYRVWISEIMLQQTRVEAVKPYFERFITELPDNRSLAECQEERLLKLWEGLGYYNRARNLQTAARQIETDYKGTMPSDYSELLKLKGIGHYTAGAIASIAFGKQVPAVDGNVFRVLTRLTADSTDITKASFRNHLEEVLSGVIPKEHAGAYNQALMELGATVCVPNGLPKCEECPWQEICRAHLSGSETLFPVKSAQKARRIEEKTILIIRDGTLVALRRRPSKGLLAGMYEFPWKEGYLTDREALRAAENFGFSPVYIEELPPAKHIFSHVEWQMKAFLIRTAEMEEVPEGLLLVKRETAEKDYPIPAAFSAYTRYLQIRLGIKEN